MEAGQIIISVPIPLIFVIPAGFVLIFALVRGLLAIIPL